LNYRPGVPRAELNYRPGVPRAEF